ncbi:hypothetical protein H0H92_001330, partial [Tricholoma furcatifolium]
MPLNVPPAPVLHRGRGRPPELPGPVRVNSTIPQVIVPATLDAPPQHPRPLNVPPAPPPLRDRRHRYAQPVVQHQPEAAAIAAQLEQELAEQRAQAAQAAALEQIQRETAERREQEARAAALEQEAQAARLAQIQQQQQHEQQRLQHIAD